ncbi:MAG: hypothetical protein ACI4PU_07835 [Intestinibacter sp.]
MKIKDYKNKLEEIEKSLQKLGKKSNFISWVRVALFVVIMGLLSYGYFNKNSLFYVLAFILTVVFFVSVKWHNNMELEIKYKQSKCKVYKRYIKRLNGTWYDFKDKGTEYLDENMPYLKDLDIFGEGSLYQYICSANTVYGKKCLVNHLKKTEYNLDEIIKHQQSVKELSHMQDFSNEIETLSYLINENKKSAKAA